jgi:hypothetical protein
MEIRIRKLEIDSYGYDPPHTEFFISNNQFSATIDEYIDESFWVDFGKSLQLFPKHLQDEVVFPKIGIPETYNPIYLRAFVYDGSGHCALEVKIIHQSSAPYSAFAHFFILREAASLNRLGKSLEKWVNSDEWEFVFNDGY